MAYGSVRRPDVAVRPAWEDRLDAHERREAFGGNGRRQFECASGIIAGIMSQSLHSFPAAPDPVDGSAAQKAPRDAVYRARGITKVYHMGEVDVHALRGVDLDLYEGEFVVLLGPSGSGKSTLLNILGGLDVPTEGRVSYRGKDLTKDDDARLTAYRRDHVAFVF